MTFNSIQFLTFFIILLIAYFGAPSKYRKGILIAANYYFYMCWNAEYALVLLFVTLFTFVIAKKLSKIHNKKNKRRILFYSVVLLTVILTVFKYSNVLYKAINSFFLLTNISIKFASVQLIIPIGISFYIIQTIGYLFDVYREKIPAENNLFNYVLFVSFFPQILSGPIERAGNMLPQYRQRKIVEPRDIYTGLELVAWGIFKKSVIADLVAPVVSKVFGSPSNYSGQVLIIGVFLYSFQIYCDFSGYSDIAVGVARIMGFRLIVNFKQPYFAKSISDFWRRWHISLSSWLRDYVFFPLGGPFGKPLRWIRNVLITFIVCGLWHGLNWTFFLWGAFHGALTIIGVVTKNLRKNIVEKLRLNKLSSTYKWARIISTFCLVNIGWVLFRASSLLDVKYIFFHIFRFNRFRLTDLFELGLPRYELVVALLFIILLIFVDYSISEKGLIGKKIWQNKKMRLILDMSLVFIIIFFGVFNKIEFIYFQF